MRDMHKGHGGPHHDRHHHHGKAGIEKEFRGGMGRRMFEQGHLRLLILSLLEERARHGYEIIKAIEELAGGDYTPSPGVIYPTLTLLEETGLASVSELAGKKQYAITPDGAALVASEAEALARVRARLGAAESVAEARRSPELQQAMHKFKAALHQRLSQGEADTELTRKIATVIERAAQDIGQA
ncbi:MAG: PadR family transcriptional regulator [Candidatus Dactylopiibacterium carminicum]|uniref:PadR family transcriptional regulator n=1 Tax=Candidatus Dactylopiibacterium carminicum TaxID=857335 RepID=A0A272EVD9_9RHOO|nr:PadR family transcriptional regulator [Candidatus Dactylopiibacterium carminicum]KAF7600108.1 PadR family transcriptional regulator [Candidatus Dactylopiibacterium carminicum]PAS94062.1 MAG: PadR family transcriptional regulator [Candidatus Dactylopiibacterium carminicum]PAS98175.1 MAG: PadR family transcriptional regulator [Candidatus Dactylopiibacterium carminicum]PAT00108.1 MAG: hypothetical protein BSR46_04265 [Candidatus Dactylopiibacterium carminicum]